MFYKELATLVYLSVFPDVILGLSLPFGVQRTPPQARIRSPPSQKSRSGPGTPLLGPPRLLPSVTRSGTQFQLARG